ncbi:DNA-binding NarL/FixJ family response regulator [Kibdelosporangium banguiense]|uniref:DNA-binding NarL/FixJ family response regulator n=1 Tax=Kibdelosporangium banguiense TaxID=1365924 RepID=A0ABS4THL5_9PSEU|nr:response regulator transcription factor [Kibdelosporangium banguiense]MBP2323927.1 DNA-binding NarL/FixJ family response regulator [Kibdelosporangium banguiense]
MRIVIAEDSAVLRDGLSLLLTTRGHEVQAAVSTGEALAEAIAEHVPDIAVVDVRMPPTFTDEGIRAALAVRKTHPSVGLLVFSQHIETRYAAELLASGARGVGYLLKDRVADVKDFLSACEQIADGGTVLDPEVVTQVLGASRRAQDLSALTAREREVLSLMAEGRTNTAIAKAMFISEGSVEKHISSIFAKLGLPPSEADHRRVLAVLKYLAG